MIQETKYDTLIAIFGIPLIFGGIWLVNKVSNGLFAELYVYLAIGVVIGFVIYALLLPFFQK